MSLSLLLLVLAQSVTPPPMVEAPPTPAPERDFPLWQVTALGTATLPTSLEGAGFTFGLRGEVDVWRISALITFDRTGITPTAAAMTSSPLTALTTVLAPTRTWTGLVGYSVLINHWVRIRALGGVSALTTDSTSVFAPSFGGTARVNWKFLGAEAGLVFTPGAFRQLDLRAEAILQAGLLEIHLGYRARFSDETTTGTLATLFAAAPVAGPSLALGVSF